MLPAIPKVLTIAGSDSGGGAGIQADLKTFHALGTYGLSAITALTAQNTTGVYGIQSAEPDFFRTQLDAVLRDIEISAAKTGMLANSDIVRITYELCCEYKVHNLVIDPVMVSKHGAKLLKDEAVNNYKKMLFPIAKIITPNLNEAALLTGVNSIRTKIEMKIAAEKLKKNGPEIVVVKGGHLDDTDSASDLYFDGDKFTWLKSKRYDMKHTHGTGCTFSAATAAFLAKGYTPFESVKMAKGFIALAIKTAWPLGKGIGPVNHLCLFSGYDEDKLIKSEISIESE